MTGLELLRRLSSGEMGTGFKSSVTRPEDQTRVSATCHTGSILFPVHSPELQQG